MGRSICLYSFDTEKLITKICEYCSTDEKKLVTEILLSFGSFVGDRYILLNQEMWEDSNCYYGVARVLNHVFKVEDSFGEVFCSFDTGAVDRQELISSVGISEAMEKFSGVCAERNNTKSVKSRGFCEQCSSTGVVYRFWANHKKQQVADDWVYCDRCYPDSTGFYKCPWFEDTGECEEITLDKYNELSATGYREL